MPREPSGPGALLLGAEPALGTARVSLVGGRPVWQVGGNEVSVAAGSGIPAQIVDLVLRAVGGENGRADHAPGLPGSLPPRERGIPVDQTHVSVIVDERWVVKIVGAWGSADRSAAILERLQRAGSTAAPRFVGALEWQHPERGRSALALVAEYVPDSDDGWTWAVDDTLAYILGGGDPGQTDRGALPDWPARVGELTTEMHTALRVSDEGSGAGPDPRVHDRDHAEAVFDRAFEAIDATTPPSDGGFALRMRARKAALAAAIRTIPGGSAAPLIIPHGDFHVGQLLRTRSGRYLVLDFDGDPQWAPERRLRPDGAVRDVAHMLVSIDLVAAVVQRRLGRADERVWAWGRAAQQQFLDAYRAASEPGLLDTSALRGLMAEQLLSELSYADHYLAEWRYAPDGVISRRYPREEPPVADDAVLDSHGADRSSDGRSGDPYPDTDPPIADSTEPSWNPPVSPTT